MVRNKKTSLDEMADEFLKEENPTAKAVDSLIHVSERTINDASDVELKTDLSADEIKTHAVADLLSSILEQDKATFKKKSIFSALVHNLEKKAISKNRQSRQEIVAVARQPDMNMPLDVANNENFVKRMFSSHRK